MSEEEILRYILCCVSYKHMFDLSPRITDSDRKKENLLFSSAVYFLRELCKNKNITVEDIKKESTMKEVTYEDWQKNSTPRMMWVWNEDEMYKVKRKVVYVVRNNYARVVTIDDDDSDYESYNHCAEIKKQRRMTNKELSRWLREKPTREYKYLPSDYIYSAFNYREYKQDEEVHKDTRIREDGGDWRKPLVEA